ncbi:MAG: carboxypeptidase regulatory-like domain-containing protein, partial [Acidobacteriia bacterium]|nr:carboxypeptidase regulatory-like domain-containing protein [Terriglobia bacterium]
PQGAVIPGAKVTLTNEGQGAAGPQLVTSPEGTFVFSPVLPGRYTVTVESTGFKKYSQSGITLDVNDKLGLPPIKLEVGATGESVTVEANAVQLQTVTAERAGVVDGRQIVDIALNGRNFNNLLRTVPGAMADGTISVNGQRTDQANFTVDGQTVIDTGVNVQTGFGYRISVDAMAEFKVSSNAMSAEFGRNSGAQIQVVTKSGTQDFHGGGYWFKRGEFMNANTFVNNATPVIQNGKAVPQFPIYRYMTLGYNIGGPIYIPKLFNRDKQKLFFFISQEWNRQITPNAPRQITVPTALERQGNFSQTRDSAGVPVIIKDPATGQPFPNNIIPANRFNPLGQAILNYLPMPNVFGNPSFNYQSQVPSVSPQFDEVYRVDYNINPKWRLFGRAMRSHNTQNNPYGRGDSANVLALSALPAPTFAWPDVTVNLATIISPTLTNEIQYGYTKNGIPGGAPPSTSPYYRSVSNLQIPLLYPTADPIGLVPNFGFGGVPGPSWLTNLSLTSQFNGLPYANANPLYNAIDNLTKVAGTHTIKAGFFLEHAIKTESAFGDVNSTIAFGRDPLNPGDTNWAFSNALLGNFQSYTQFSRYPIGNYPYMNIEWYAQDSWKATPRLTINYGLRFNLVPPSYEQRNNVANFLPSLFNPSQAVRLFQPALINGQRVANDAASGQTLSAAYIGFIVPGSGNPNDGTIQAGVNGEPRGLMQSRGIQWGPRLGLAYQLTDKTVVRMGGGVFYERVVAGMIRTQATDPPFVRQ